jgi:hypothetical protein
MDSRNIRQFTSSCSFFVFSSKNGGICFECLGKTLVDHVFLYNGHDSYAACSPLGMFQTAFASKFEGLRCSNYECWVHYPTSEKTELLNLGKKSKKKD